MIKFLYDYSNISDKEDILTTMNNPLIYKIVRIIPKSADERVSFVEKLIQNSHCEGNYTVRNSLGDYIGNVGLHPINEEEAELGYFLNPQFHGQGYATKIASIFIERARNLGFKKLIATAALDNIASHRVLEKNGFIKTGIIHSKTYENEVRVSAKFEFKL